MLAFAADGGAVGWWWFCREAVALVAECEYW